MVGYEVALNYPTQVEVGESVPISATATCPTGCLRGRLYVDINGYDVIRKDLPNLGRGNNYSQTFPAGTTNRFQLTGTENFTISDGEVVFKTPGEYEIGWRVYDYPKGMENVETFTITVTPAPPSFEASCTTPSGTQPPDSQVDIPVTVSNNGASGTASVSLLVDNDPVESTTISVSGGGSETVTFNVTLPGTPGEQTTYSIGVDAAVA